MLAGEVASARSETFDECARKLIAAKEAGWRNAKHRAQWPATLKTYASPVFGRLPVSEIDTGLVLQAIEPIWRTKPETASRLRGRIEAVLDWARVHEFRTGENPARWKGHLDHLLPAGNKLRRVTHHRALPYTEVAAFMAQLEERKDLAALALRCLILTAARTSELVGARWEEVDLQEKVWTVPPERMKGGREHRIPLSYPVMSIFSQLAEGRHGEFVFPGAKQGHSLRTWRC